MNYYNHQVIWITGASSGIGAALARGFAKQGARLVLSGRNVNALEEVAAECGVLGADDILSIAFDTTEFDRLEDIVAQVQQWHGQIDVLINNAGISQRSLVRDTHMDIYRKVMEIDYFAPVALTKLVLPIMTAQQGGHIMVVTSLTGKIGSKMRSGYCAAKHALHGFYDSLRAEEHQNNLKVTLCLPGYINTNVSRSALTGDGSVHNALDEGQTNAISADEAASYIIPQLVKAKPEIYVGRGIEMWAPVIKRFFPNLLIRLLNKQKIAPVGDKPR